jgi:hypothetical protein
MTGDAMRDVIDSALDAAIEGEFGGLAASADEIAVIRDYVLAAITAAPASARLALARAITPDTHAVVPVEATDTMTLEANKRVAICTIDGTWALARYEAKRTWCVMIAAARGADAEGQDKDA